MPSGEPNELSRRENQDSSHRLTVIRPEVSFVSGNKITTVRGYRRCQDRPIFCLEINRFWQVRKLGRIAYDPRLHEEVLEGRESVRFGKGDIPSCYHLLLRRQKSRTPRLRDAITWSALRSSYRPQKRGRWHRERRAPRLSPLRACDEEFYSGQDRASVPLGLPLHNRLRQPRLTAGILLYALEYKFQRESRRQDG